MSIRARESLEIIKGVTMIVRTMSGIGATYEQFKPYSLDDKGAMLVLQGRVDLDAPIRVIVNADGKIAGKFAEKAGVELSSFNTNKDGSFQLSGNWLKVKWTRNLDEHQIDLIGCNKLLWNIWENFDEINKSFMDNAKNLFDSGFTTNIDIMQILKKIIKNKPIDYSLDKKGLEELARKQEELNQKILYCLLGGFSYGDILHSIVSFKEKYIRDPFQKRYGILHGTMALNQGDEDWSKTFSILKDITQ